MPYSLTTKRGCMKKILFFATICATLCSLFLTAEHDNSTKLFSGSIEFPMKIDSDLCIFYKGQKLCLDKSSANEIVQFSFIDHKDTQTIFLIITQAISCLTEESNTIQHLQLTKANDYICYKLQAQRNSQDDEHELLTWKIEQHHLEKGILPQNSLILLFDPNLISGIKIQSWKPECVFRLVPTIIVLPTATEKEINRTMVIARLAALDVDAIHAKSQKPISTHAVLISTLNT